MPTTRDRIRSPESGTHSAVLARSFAVAAADGVGVRVVPRPTGTRRSATKRR